MEVNSKYRQILITGKELFWKYGVKRVSVEEICREANVSKMTFYKFFPNKKELALEIVKKVVGKSVDEFKEVVAGNLSFQEKVKRMFTIKMQAAKDISIEFITDLYKNPELGIHTYMDEMGAYTLRIFVEFLRLSQDEGLIRENIKVEFILAYQTSLMQLMENKELMSKYNSPFEFIMESMNFLFYGILTEKARNEK